MTSYWALPGPKGFVEKIISAVRDGHNVVVATPVRVLPGLDDALEQKLHSENWRVFGPRCDDGSLPNSQVVKAAEVRPSVHSRWSMADLCRELPPASVIIINGVRQERWPKWRELLLEYESASRNVPEFDRTRLIVLAAGVSHEGLPRRQAALSPLIWNDVVQEIDVLLHLASRTTDRRDPSARVCSQIVLQIGLWDLPLVDFLVDLPANELFEPKTALARAASALEGIEGLSDDWESGGKMAFEGRDCTHSLVVLQAGDHNGEIEMRLWAAQAGEILPALELRRRDLTKRIRTMVSRPIRLGEKVFNDVDDLELGQLADLAYNEHLSLDICRAAQKWRGLRNKLAHLEPLSASEALDPNLLCGTAIQQVR